MPWKFAAACLALTLAAGCATSPPPPPILPADHNGPPKVPSPVAGAGISAERMSAMTRELASDDYQGRSMGGPGEEKSIAYLVDQFRKAGLEPGGENGGWTQTVPMIRTKLQNTSVSIRQSGATRAIRVPDDIYLSTVRDTTRAQIANAPMVFVGYGVTAPERQWDDFKGADLHGKVAVFLVNDPDFEALPGEEAAGVFGDKTMTYYGRWTYKFEEAAKRGAIAALVVHQTEGAGYGWNVVQSPAAENFNVVLEPGARQPVLLQGWIQGPLFADILKASGQDAAAVLRQARTRAFKPIDLKTTMSADAGVELTRLTSHNIIAKLPGATHPDEYVSYGGHWDAYGIGPADAQGRTIRPGASDDALGLAAMIEVARQFAQGPRPQRSLLFFAFTAEERGLLGSEYYARHPLYPHDKTVANLTFDTLQWAGPAKDVVLIGKGQSDMEDLLADAARTQGRYVTIENHPERGLFYRADHFSFAKRGVPVLLNMALAGSYDLQDGGRAAGDKWLNDFTSACYHQTCDAWSPSWNLGGAVQEAALFQAIGARLANSRQWPAWKPGSEFGKVRQESQAKRAGGERG